MIRTQTNRREDGRVEVLRIRDGEPLAEGGAGDSVAFEKSIIWLEDVSNLPYVRCRLVPGCTSRRGPVKLKSPDRRVVGFARLLREAPTDAETGTYTRRVFYLKDEDEGATPRDPIPAGAVHPDNVLPGATEMQAAIQRAQRLQEQDSDEYLIEVE